MHQNIHDVIGCLNGRLQVIFILHAIYLFSKYSKMSTYCLYNQKEKKNLERQKKNNKGNMEMTIFHPQTVPCPIALLILFQFTEWFPSLSCSHT